MNWKVECILLLISLVIASSQGFIFDVIWDVFTNTNRPTRNPFKDWLSTRTDRPSLSSTTVEPINPRCPACSCGYANPSKRIINGQETNKNQYPWVAMLRYVDQFYCGATVINDLYVLTAAHCVRGIPEDGISVRMQVHSRIDADPQTIDRLPVQIIEHPEFDPITFNNDVAVIKLDRKINFTNTFRPVCLAKGSQTFVGKMGTAAGWGATSEGGSLADNLLEIQVPIISNEECATKHMSITQNMLCAGDKSGEKDSCQGDSGGAFTVPLQNNRYTQVGVISWGDGCGKPDVPGVYVRLTNYYNWIRSKTRDACYCS